MTETTVRIALAQLNLTVGDISGNTDKIIEYALKARDEKGADIVVYPELAITGYPPEDLLLRPGLHRRVERHLEDICHAISGIDLLISYPHYSAGKLFNTASLIRDNRVIATYHKQHLPNYAVFDEQRYFYPGHKPVVVDIKGIPISLSICEDIWEPGTMTLAHNAGARLMLNINASPYHVNKGAEREKMLRERVREAGIPVVYLNLVGGQDELVFDGGSMVIDHEGTIVFKAPEFEEGLYTVDFDEHGHVNASTQAYRQALPEEESIYNALVLGVRDYVTKNSFKGAVIGLSGGIDSALTLVIAVDALGSENVEVLLMPSQYTAAMSVEDARLQADTLGVGYNIISVENVFSAFLDSLSPLLANTEPDTTEENIQARCRGILLMALSNKFGKIVLATGNRSEMAVGYATLYGDMAGGFAPLKNVPKTMVYRLAEWRNRNEQAIPQRVIDRPPSAELAPNQKDEDNLPPYSVLDPILELYIDRDQTPQQIIDAGYERSEVEKVVTLVDRNEYKRRQAAPGVRITQKAFGRDRRYPISSGYNEITPS